MANGDITLTAPKVVTTGLLTLVQLVLSLSSTTIQVTFQESATGILHTVIVTDAGALGLDYAGGVFTDSVVRVISNEYTKLLGIMFGAGASTPAQRKTAAIQALITDGVITVAGTVG